MTEVFRVPGGWDDIHSESAIGKAFRKRYEPDCSDTESVVSADTLYRNFITMAKGSNGSNKSKGNNKVKKGDPIIVRIDGEPATNAYQFPFEFVNTWLGFQQCLQDAFPEYSRFISKKELILIDKNHEFAFIPSHYTQFIRPGQEIMVKFHKPLTQRQKLYILQQQRLAEQQRQKYGDSHNDSEGFLEEDDYYYHSDATSENHSKRKPRSPRSNKTTTKGMHRMISWLTE